MVDVLTFYSQFSPRTPASDEGYRDVGHAVGRFVNAVNRLVSDTPLSIRELESPSKIRKARGEVRSRKIVSLSFKGRFNLGSSRSRSFAS